MSDTTMLKKTLERCALCLGTLAVRRWSLDHNGRCICEHCHRERIKRLGMDRLTANVRLKFMRAALIGMVLCAAAGGSWWIFRA